MLLVVSDMRTFHVRVLVRLLVTTYYSAGWVKR
jgi:hypothetical protein